MLVYEKKVNGVRHLFGTMGHTPKEADSQLTYKKIDGTAVTPTFNDKFVDGGSANGTQRMKDLAENINANVSVFIDNNCIIGDAPAERVSEPEHVQKFSKERHQKIVEQIKEKEEAAVAVVTEEPVEESKEEVEE